MEQDRIAEFEREVADLKLKTSGGQLERWSGVLGVLLMLFGIGVAIGAAFESGGKEDARDLDELIILNLAMLGLVLVGGVLFLRRALQQFWRFWMLRQTFEHQRHIEVLLQAVRRPAAEGGGTVGATPTDASSLFADGHRGEADETHPSPQPSPPQQAVPEQAVHQKAGS